MGVSVAYLRQDPKTGAWVGAGAVQPALEPDFFYDQLATGRGFRVLNIVDDVTRECLRAVVDPSISSKRVVRELADLVAERDKPGMIVSDNGIEMDFERGARLL